MSVASPGLELGTGDSFEPVISGTGRFIAFESSACLVEPCPSFFSLDIFVYDRALRKTTRASVDSEGKLANSVSESPAISANGRFVAFVSSASNLVLDDTNGLDDVFVHDRESGETIRVSVSSSGEQANGSSFASGRPSLSADGRFVAFESRAANLVLDDRNDAQDVFIHDLLTRATTRVSVSSGGEEGIGDSYGPSLSGDGRFIAFTSRAPNLVPGDTNGLYDIFVRDLVAGQTSRVSVSSSGEEAQQDPDAAVRSGGSSGAAISADGRFVAFDSEAANLVPGDTNARERSGPYRVPTLTDVFVHDRIRGETTRASVSSAGEQAFDDQDNSNLYSSSTGSSISAHGRFVAFVSNTNTLVPEDTNHASDVFVHGLHYPRRPACRVSLRRP